MPEGFGSLPLAFVNVVLCLESSTDVYLCVLHRVGFTLKNLPLTCSLWTSLSTQLCDGQTEIVSVITKRGFRPVHSNCAGQRSAPESLLLTACCRFWTVVGTRRATDGEEQVSVLRGVHSNGVSVAFPLCKQAWVWTLQIDSSSS